MKWNRQIRNSAMVSVLALPVVLSGCSLFGTGPSSQIDPPPTDIETQMMQGTGAAGQTSLAAGEAVSTVYLQNDHGLLAPISLHLSQRDDATAKTTAALEALVSDGPYAKLLPAGFVGVLPKGTEVKAVTLKSDEKLAVVEFSKEFANYPAADERKIAEALTWTLIDNPEIENVQLWMDGAKLNEMPVGGMPLDRPLNRSLGINLQLDNETNLSQSNPVTVFFSAATEDGTAYFVPVTRFVPYGSDLVAAAVDELIKGPMKGDGLENAVTQNTVLDGVERSDNGVVTVSIDDDMFDPGEKLPAQMMQSLVLTVSENSAQDKVRIWLNGEKEVVGTDNQDYGQPVMRPQGINDIAL
ncbi:MAG TPA: GerMN domain-containing protein [Paenibacillus sp.]|jgi:germination protein M